MRFLIRCVIGEDRMAALLAHRLEHLEYIRANRDLIAFGGPTRGADGSPETMVIVVDAQDADAARRFIDAEPYNASGEVFERVEVDPWSQVMPDCPPGRLDGEIEAERSRREGSRA